MSIAAPRALADHLARAGIHDPAVLNAVREVPREAFLPPELQELAYEDKPLPIGEGQTISQPLIVALMAQAARLRPEHRVLEVGTGSGYAAAVFSRLVSEVYSIERLHGLAEIARERLEEMEYDNVHLREGDGTLGWPEAAPFDAILVAAGGPEPPPTLLEQLAPGGRLIIPVGTTTREQRLVCIERLNGRFRRSDLGAVRFVPLVGAEGWATPAGDRPVLSLVTDSQPAWRGLPHLLREVVEPLPRIEGADLSSLTAHIGDARVVLIGEASHGTSEFYRTRAEITKELIERHGFTMVAIEGDWPDAAPRSHAFPHGCGGTARRRASSPGSGSGTRTVLPRHAPASTASTCTACTRRSMPCSATWTRSIPMLRAWRVSATGA